MNRDEKYIARLKFQNELFKSDGQKFQDLFVRIMQRSNKDFSPVKPHGNVGDRKNDGFDKVKGIYYQVYAPENIDIKITDAVNKLKEDFEGLKSFWSNIYPIKEFYFTVNDKYKGLYPAIYEALAELEKDNTVVKFNPFIAKDLEDVFINLPDDDIIDVVGFIPSSETIEMVDYSILSQVVGYLVENLKPLSIEEKLDRKEFDDKIKFNTLSKTIADLLYVSSYQVSVLDEFFQYSSSYTRKELSDIFKALYNEAKEGIADVENASDRIFLDILTKASPKNTKFVQDAVMVLMSYYFEVCDIFETPEEEDKK